MRTFLMGKVGFVEKKVWEPNCWINVVSPTQDDLRYLIDLSSQCLWGLS